MFSSNERHLHYGLGELSGLAFGVARPQGGGGLGGLWGSGSVFGEGFDPSRILEEGSSGG